MLRLRLVVVVMCFTAACASSTPDEARPPVGTAAVATTPVQELSVDAGDVTLHVRVVGPAGADAGATVITVHGGPGLSLEAMAVFERLAGPDRRVVGYDQRGTGRSTSPADADFGLSAQVADLDAVRLALGVDMVQLVGQSWGGVVAAAYAAEHPDHVSALVLVGAIPLDRDEFLAGQRRFQERVAELQGNGLIPDPVPPNDGGSCLPAFEAVLPAYLADARSHPAVSVGSCTAATSRATYEAFITDAAVEQIGERLSAFSGRALVVMGEHDPFGTEWVDRNIALLAGAQVELSIVRAAGHLVMVEQRDAVLETISTFLTG